MCRTSVIRHGEILEIITIAAHVYNDFGPNTLRPEIVNGLAVRLNSILLASGRPCGVCGRDAHLFQYRHRAGDYLGMGKVLEEFVPCLPLPVAYPPLAHVKVEIEGHLHQDASLALIICGIGYLSEGLCCPLGRTQV